MATTAKRTQQKPTGAAESRSSAKPSPSNAVTLPLLHTKVHLPPPERAAYYTGIGVLVALEVIEWPIALIVAAGHALASRSHNQVVEGLAESAEDS